MHIIIAGSRTLRDGRDIWDLVESLPRDTTVITGGAQGADAFGTGYAIARGLKVLVFKPNWDKYGPSAGFKRNEQMLVFGDPDAVFVYYDGSVRSNGSAHIAELAQTKDFGINVVETFVHPN